MASPDIPGRFSAWEPIDEAMDRLHERFVGHYDEPTSWDYSIWLGLTEAGPEGGEGTARRLRTLAARESAALLI